LNIIVENVERYEVITQA